MPTQRNLPPRGGQITESIAAMQRGFSKPVIELNRLTPKHQRLEQQKEHVVCLILSLAKEELRERASQVVSVWSYRRSGYSKGRQIPGHDDEPETLSRQIKFGCRINANV